MNRPDAKWRSDRWTCRSTRRLGPRSQARSDPVRSAIRLPAQPDHHAVRRPERQLAFDGVASHDPELRIEAPEGRMALDGFVDIGGRNPVLGLHARSELGPCTRGATDPGRCVADSARVRGARRKPSLTAADPVASPTLDSQPQAETLGIRIFHSVEHPRKVNRSMGTASAFISSTSRRQPGSLSCERRIAVPGQRRVRRQPRPPRRGMDGCRRGSRVVSAGYTLPCVDRHTRVRSRGPRLRPPRCHRAAICCPGSRLMRR